MSAGRAAEARLEQRLKRSAGKRVCGWFRVGIRIDVFEDELIDAFEGVDAEEFEGVGGVVSVCEIA